MTEPPLGAGLVPELDVTDIGVSLEFYAELLGFGVVFERRAERFAYLTLGAAELMLQQAGGPGRGGSWLWPVRSVGSIPPDLAGSSRQNVVLRG